jgi:hypothetical protein
VLVDTDFSDAQILGAAASFHQHRLADVRDSARNGKKERGAARWPPLPGRENL